jgi:hypothetical protein
MWWTDDPVYLYEARLAAEGSAAGEVAFRVLPESGPASEPEPRPREPGGNGG